MVKKILLANTYDVGGAANACIRLHSGLLAQGVASTLLVKQKTGNDTKNVIAFAHNAPHASAANRLKHKAVRIMKEVRLLPQLTEAEKEGARQRAFIKNRPAGLDLFTFPYADCDITTQQAYNHADVVNLHWVADFVDLKRFFEKNKKPVVWTLHDEAPYLGGEHYAERYLGMDSLGRPMPRTYTAAEIQEQKAITAYKREVFKHAENLHIVTPSKWLYDKSSQSELLGRFPHYHIPNGFPTHIFKPYNKAFARQVLGIPEQKKVLLFVADTITHQRKGFAYLQQAIARLNNEVKAETVICTVGNKQGNINNGESALIELGRIQDERLMALAYSAADVFIIPSLEDNLPNTMIEALLCGTPVIGFVTGGIAETIVNGKNGYLCPEISVEALKNTIDKFISEPSVFCAEQIAADANEQYSLTRQANSYIQLYSQIAKTN